MKWWVNIKTKGLFWSLLLSGTLLLANNPYPPSKLPKQATLKFSMYPNPLEQGPLYLQCPSDLPKEITIYNVMGEVVYTHTTQAPSLQLDHLENGIYFIQVTQDQKTGVQRLVVK